jgi:GAF domain-containing protein
MTHVAPLDPNDAFAELSRIKLDEVDIAVVLDKVAELAKRTIPGAREVSVTLVNGDTPSTAAFTGQLALSMDESQYARGHGPCLDAAASSATISVPDTATEGRWSDWARVAKEAGAHSSLSIGLPVHERVTGALNIYATEAHAFDADAITLAQNFAGYAAVALANIHLYETQASFAAQIQKAMESRAVIEQAKGIIMGDRRCTAADAFAVLGKLSQDSGRSLRDVATVLVDDASQRG